MHDSGLSNYILNSNSKYLKVFQNEKIKVVNGKNPAMGV